MSVVGEFRRILCETAVRLRELEVAGAGRFAEELEAVADEADDVSSAAAAVLDLVVSRDRIGALPDGDALRGPMSSTASIQNETDVAPERLGAATEHLTAVCRAILGRT